MRKHLIILSATMPLALGACNQNAPDPVFPVPTEEQLEWQKDEVWAFVHFGPNTFSDREWGYGDADPAIFNPSSLDCGQWVETFSAAGIKGVIITAKHHDGFCLWPSEYTDYSIAASPYKDGQGDVVGELSAACAAAGLKFGVYLSPWDRHQETYGSDEYVEYYYKQLRELLTRYGRISEVWLDGANGGDGWYGGASETRNIDRRTYYGFPTIHSIINELQPGAIIFSDGGPGCRWVGNERGEASMTNWSFLRKDEVYPGYPNAGELGPGHPDGDAWIPAECDVSIRPGWFYHSSEDDDVKTPEQLADLYYESVGRNGKLLLNFPVDSDGLIHPMDSANVVEASKIIRRELSDNILLDSKLSASSSRGRDFAPTNVLDPDCDKYWSVPDGMESGWLEFKLPEPRDMDRIVIQEYIPLGQRVKSFDIEYNDGNSWRPLVTDEEMTTIGYKRILRFDPVKAEALRINVADSRACPCIVAVAAYFSIGEH